MRTCVKLQVREGPRAQVQMLVHEQEQVAGHARVVVQVQREQVVEKVVQVQVDHMIFHTQGLVSMDQGEVGR